MILLNERANFLKFFFIVFWIEKRMIFIAICENVAPFALQSSIRSYNSILTPIEGSTVPEELSIKYV